MTEHQTPLSPITHDDLLVAYRDLRAAADSFRASLGSSGQPDRSVQEAIKQMRDASNRMNERRTRFLALLTQVSDQPLAWFLAEDL